MGEVKERERWGGKFDFFLTALGYAVGLGIWDLLYVISHFNPCYYFEISRSCLAISLFMLQKWRGYFKYNHKIYRSSILLKNYFKRSLLGAIFYISVSHWNSVGLSRDGRWAIYQFRTDDLLGIELFFLILV